MPNQYDTDLTDTDLTDTAWAFVAPLLPARELMRQNVGTSCLSFGCVIMCTQQREATCKHRKSGFGNFGRGWQRSWRHPDRSPLLGMERRWDIISLPAQARMPRMWRLYGQPQPNSTRFLRPAEPLKTNW